MSLTQCDRYGANLRYTFGESYFWNLKIVSDYYQANLVKEHSVLLSVLSYSFVNLVVVYAFSSSSASRRIHMMS